METKKSKKSTKIMNVMVKSIIKDCKNNNNSYRLIIQIKGTKITFYKILEFLKDLLGKRSDVYFIYTPTIPSNGKKFKKIRSLKKNFRKKYLKVN
jgi:hypothetical protein